jgi:hypothetical protein
MKTQSSIRWILLLGLAIAISACQQKKKEAQVLARVNNTELTAQEYRDQDFYYNFLSHLTITNPDQRVQAMVESEVLFQEAEKQKLIDL